MGFISGTSPLQTGMSYRRRKAVATGASGAAQFAAAAAASLVLAVAPVAPPEGNCPECLGVVDGLLADCPERLSCVSSQDDSPMHFQEPWEYEVGQSVAYEKLLSAVKGEPGARVVKAADDYIRAEFVDRFGNIDDAEFYFTKNDNTVQFRSNRRGSALDFNTNKARMEKLRKKLGFGKVPILRNRRRVFVFFESPWDSFGPTTSKNMDVRGAEDGPGDRFDMDPLAPAPQPLRNKYGRR